MWLGYDQPERRGFAVEMSAKEQRRSASMCVCLCVCLYRRGGGSQGIIRAEKLACYPLDA